MKDFIIILSPSGEVLAIRKSHISAIMHKKNDLVEITTLAGTEHVLDMTFDKLMEILKEGL